MAADRRCGTCRHLVVEPNRAGRRVVRKDSAYECTAPLPELPPLPDSVTRAFGYVPLEKLGRSYMSGDRGTECPLWEPLS